MNYISGGYYVVSETERPSYTNEKVVPKKLFSASGCISNFYPSLDILWNSDIEKKYVYAQTLSITKPEYEKLENWISHMSALNLFGYPNVFVDIEYAKLFYNKWLQKTLNTKIIGIGLSKKYVDELIEVEDLKSVSPEERTVIENLFLRSNPICTENQKLLGYEVLGYIKGSGEFHSYLCNGLEKEYSQHFSFKANELGLISTLEEAEKYAEFSNEEDIESEEVLWLPWGIYEYL